MKKYAFVYFILSPILLIILLESISYLYLKRHQLQQPFLVNTKDFYFKEKRNYEGYGFKVIDPFLGWGRTEQDVTDAGFAYTNGCAEFVKSVTEKTGKTILITGGSTSDIILDKNNWPNEFNEKLKAINVNARVVVASIGGYNSGQELLKLIRDGLLCNPDIHISYSGANDVEMPYYVSNYEQIAFTKILKNNYATLLPNFIFMLNSVLIGNAPILHKQNTITASAFYAKNMRLMRSVNQEQGCEFIGILQPVVNSSNLYRQTEVEEKYAYQAGLYRKFYPAMRQFADTTSFMADFTGIFDTAAGKVFTDDCHLHIAYQKTVSDRVIEELLSRKFLP